MEDTGNRFSYETKFLSFINDCGPNKIKEDEEEAMLLEEEKYDIELKKSIEPEEKFDEIVSTLKDQKLLNFDKNYTSENCRNTQFDNTEVKEEIEIKVELSSFSIKEDIDCQIKEESTVKNEVDEDTFEETRECVLERNFYCPHCNKGYTQKKHLNEHVRSVHEKIRNHACGFCDKRFFKKYEKAVHERKHTGEKPHQCQICGESFKKKFTLDEHMSIHTGIQEFSCVDCGKSFGLQRSLHHHRLMRHTHQLPCSMCEKKFSTKSHLERHMKGHLGIKDSQCVECGKQFSSDRSLKQHIENEHNEKPETKEIFICPECGKEFKYINNMKTHMKIHAKGHAKVQCQECGKYYKTVRVLKDHIRIIHEGNSKFKCDVCGKAFGRAPALEVHKTTHTKPYQCQICCQGYKVHNHLVKHMEKEHTNSIHCDIKYTV